MNEILQVAMFAGQMILENGGETYRVEETIWRICKIYGADEAESFATPTGIMASICHQGKTYSLTRRVSNRTVNLDKIDKVNDLSRSIQSKKLSVSDFKRELDKINNLNTYSFLIVILFSGLAAGSFSILFGGNFKDAFSAFLIGLVIKGLELKWSDVGINTFFINSICGGITALLAIIFFKLGISSQINQTIIGSIIDIQAFQINVINDYNITEWLTQYSEEKDVTYVRGFLGRMLFSGEDGVKKVAVLSGGEKVRCLLSKMMISGANVLLLDEPTNHLDMESITALNNGLIKFPGVLLFTSRDHQIVQTTANRIMEIVPGGKLIDKITTYDEYLESDEMARKRQTYSVQTDDED